MRCCVLGLVAVAGCYAPTPSAGLPCADGERCPAGQVCSPATSTCELVAGAIDAGDTPTIDGGSGADATAPGVDASGPAELVVTSTGASGPGTLSDAIDFLNANCAELGDDAIVSFDIPPGDAGYRGSAGARYWRITSLPSAVIMCAGAVIDGTTQTARRGDKNELEVGGFPVGAAAIDLPMIGAPEIELRGLDLSIQADGVTMRGLAMGSLGSSGDDTTIEDCWFGSEPDVVMAFAVGERAASNTLVYLGDTGGSSGHLVRRNVFAWAQGVSGEYSGLQMASNGVSVVRDNYMVGSGGGSYWDELHLNPASGIEVIHNYVFGDTWEYHVEWVLGDGTGEVSENTFKAPILGVHVVSGSAPAVDTGNVSE